MKKRLIVTIMLGKDPSFYFVKKTFKNYAKKVNADFLCITKGSPILNTNTNTNTKLVFDALFQKMSLGSLSEKYERVLYLDADILITPHAKNIFDVCKDDSQVYMYNEGLFADRTSELTLISNRLHQPIKDKNYFNAGVILFPNHSNFLQAIRLHDLEYFLFNTSWFDQTYINFKYRFNKIKVGHLSEDFNKMGSSKNIDNRFLASFIHYAGNSYCPKKQRSIFILNDYCHLYNYRLTLKEKATFAIQYSQQRLKRIKNKFRFF